MAGDTKQPEQPRPATGSSGPKRTPNLAYDIEFTQTNELRPDGSRRRASIFERSFDHGGKGGKRMRSSRSRASPSGAQPAETAMTDAVKSILAAVRLSEVCVALGATKLRSCGKGRYRCRAWWRGGSDPNVSIDDNGVWFDHASGEGGGILYLIQTVRGCSRQDAVQWLAEFAGMQLYRERLVPEDRKRWARKKAQLERDLPNAQGWRRQAVNYTEAVLSNLKSGSIDATAPAATITELREWTKLSEQLERLSGLALVEAYRRELSANPERTAAMVQRARHMEQAEFRATLRLLAISPTELEALPQTEWEP